jgi:EAL domain-containing protein (putative c-di-GMP-specific phosphodiesterase class I)
MNIEPITEEFLLTDLAAALPESWSSTVYPAGSVIFREGEPAGCAYLIERGQIQISVCPNGEEKVLAVLGQGELLGEMAPIDDQPRSATATVLSDAEVISISRQQLETVIDDSGPLMQLLLRVLLDRLRSTQRGSDANIPVERGKPIERKLFAGYEAIRGRAVEQLQMEKALQEALRRREFELYLQPIIRLSDNHLAGFETLIRWISPEKGILQPMEFLGVAEDSGLIVPIGLWVLEHSCHILGRMEGQFQDAFPGLPPLFISANVSARQLASLKDVDDMVAIIKKTGVDASHLKIEITEGLLVKNPEIAEIGMKKLKEIGVTFAIDDFGTGYSSLSYLHRFPLDTLKIDRSFVNAMLEDTGSFTIVRAVTKLAQELNMDIVAEGIERPEEITKLQELGCNYGQGFLFSRPVPVNQAMDLLTGASRERTLS